MSKQKKVAFAEGDVVMLASGGQKMTVAGDGDTKELVACEWSDSKGVFRSKQFKRTTLVLADGRIDMTDEERMDSLTALYKLCGYEVTLTPISQATKSTQS